MSKPTALFIDGPNVYATAKTLGFDVDYRLLLDYYKHNTDFIRAYYYTAVRELREDEHDNLRPLLDWISYNGYVLVQKPTKEFIDVNGRVKLKGNMDIEIACDAFDLSSTMREAVFFTGDGDFKPLILLLQRRGVRCTVVSSILTQPSMCSDELRRIADEFVELKDLNDLIRRGPVPPKVSRYA